MMKVLEHRYNQPSKTHGSIEEWLKSTNLTEEDVFCHDLDPRTYQPAEFEKFDGGFCVDDSGFVIDDHYISVMEANGNIIVTTEVFIATGHEELVYFNRLTGEFKATFTR